MSVVPSATHPYSDHPVGVGVADELDDEEEVDAEDDADVDEVVVDDSRRYTLIRLPSPQICAPGMFNVRIPFPFNKCYSSEFTISRARHCTLIICHRSSS